MKKKMPVIAEVLVHRQVHPHPIQKRHQRLVLKQRHHMQHLMPIIRLKKV